MTTTRQTILGEFQSRVRATAAREALAGLLKAHHDLATDTYVLSVDGGTGHLRLVEVGHGEIRVVLETTT